MFHELKGCFSDSMGVKGLISAMEQSRSAASRRGCGEQLQVVGIVCEIAGAPVSSAEFEEIHLFSRRVPTVPAVWFGRSRPTPQRRNAQQLIVATAEEFGGLADSGQRVSRNNDLQRPAIIARARKMS